MSVIIEELINISRTITAGDKTRALHNCLHTPEFSFAVLRLIQHQKEKQTEVEQETKDEDQGLIMDKIQCIKISQASVIETQLIVQNQPIPDSRQAVECFSVVDNDGSGKEHVFYIDEEAEHDTIKWMFVISELLKLLVQCIHSLLQKCDKYLTDILTVFIDEPEKISQYLDKMKIRKYNLSLDFMESLFPRLGAIVPPKFYHLLDNGFCELTDGEYVALEMFDNAIDPDSVDTEGLDAHYIYARVVTKMAETEVISRCIKQLLQKYKVDIGNEEIEVVAMSMYKFHREKHLKSKELVPVEIVKKPQSTLSLDQIKRKIKELLKESWSLPEDQRKRIIKRLILKWHLDEKDGNEQLCTEVFQFIQNILSRLENGENPDDDDVDGASRNARSYYNFGERMFRRGQSYASHSMKYAHYDFNSDYRDEPQPNPLESRRWLRQAKCDMEAARSSMNVTNPVPCYNWVCYKCQQCAEKALKAAWFASDSKKVNQGHDLSTVASGLGGELEKWARQLQNLIGKHTRMRYPDAVTMPKIPSDVYGQEMAEQACEITQSIVNRVASSCI